MILELLKEVDEEDEIEVFHKGLFCEYYFKLGTYTWKEVFCKYGLVKKYKLEGNKLYIG